MGILELLQSFIINTRESDKTALNRVIKYVFQYQFKAAMEVELYARLREDAKSLIKKYADDPLEAERYKLSESARQLLACMDEQKKLSKLIIESEEVLANMVMPDKLRKALMDLNASDDVMIDIKESAHRKEWTYYEKKNMSDKIMGFHEIPEIYALAMWCSNTPSMIEKYIVDDEAKAQDHQRQADRHNKIAADNRRALAYLK